MAEPAAYESSHLRNEAALANALTSFRSLLSHHHSKSWKPLSPSASASGDGSSSAANKGKGAGASADLLNGIGAVEQNKVQVHRRKDSKVGVDVVRAVCEVPFSPELGGDLEAFKAVLLTPEVRSAWDKLVEHALELQLVDPETRIGKTDYRLGWPASPRDTITISRHYSDPSTLIDVSTSLPRPPPDEEPAFLRPAPPYVRSNVHLLAWCLQLVPTSESSPSLRTPTSPAGDAEQKLRITIFWQWSLGGAVFATHQQQIASLLSSFVAFVREKGSQIPLLRSWGRGVEVSRSSWDRSGETRTVEYAVVWPEEDEVATLAAGGEGMDGVERRRARRRLERAVELGLSGREGWDVRVVTKAVGGGGAAEGTVDVSWSAAAEVVTVSPSSPNPSSSADSSPPPSRITLRLTHAPLPHPSTLIRVTLTVTRLAGGKVLRVNGDQVKLSLVESRDPRPSTHALLETDDAASTATSSSVDTRADGGSPALNSSAFSFASTGTSTPLPLGTNTPTNKPQPSPPTSSSLIQSLLRRNYIYFTSLLQEPEAKWRSTTDSRGVTVTQLNSIDPTLTIYRAEATFVGVGVWDVFATIMNPGVRARWEKGWDGAVLVEEVGELSELWWSGSKGAWPVAPRDSVTLRTAYKSPSSVHIFSFSTDDTSLFPSLPPVRTPTIRTQTDLYGWAIEALSPTTTQITLLDQSDPKGWSNKSWTPTQMVNAVAGVGEFAIKMGGPPVVNRLQGARKTASGYDVEKGVLRVEYRKKSEGSEVVDVPVPVLGEEGEVGLAGAPTTTRTTTSTALTQDGSGNIECEIRCDCSTWASSIDIVVDPPPLKISCLSRHRLSSGGGLWITIEHDSSSLSNEERVLVLVRKGSAGAREKGSVTVNGAKARVDVEMLPEDEVKLLSKRKRVKTSPVPLDQYSTNGGRAWQRGSTGSGTKPGGASSKGSESPLPTPPPEEAAEDPFVGTPTASTAPPSTLNPNTSTSLSSSTATLQPSPLSKSLSTTTDSPPSEPASPASPSSPPLHPPHYALSALSWLQTFHAEQGPELTDPAPGWSIVSDRAGTVVRKKIIPRVSEVLPVYRGDRIVQGLTAEEISSVVGAVGSRKAWDERVEEAIPLASWGSGCSTSVLTTKPAFPFKGRIFHLSTVNAAVRVPSASSTSSTSTVLFCASSSYPSSPSSYPSFDSTKLNPSSLLPAQVLLEGWILETLDPYTSSMLAIPSTRCTYVACVDHSGSVPLALNSVLNANLARMIQSVESLGKGKGPLPRVWTPDKGLVIEGPLSDEGEKECVWKLGAKEAGQGDASTLLVADATVEDGAFRALFKVGGTNLATGGNEKGGVGLGTPSVPVGAIFKSELPRSASLNFGAISAAPALKKQASTSDLTRKTSRSSLRTLASIPGGPPTTTGSSTIRSKSPPNATLASATGSTSTVSLTTTNSSTSSSVPSSTNDLIVCELVVDLKQFPHGYSVATTSSLISPDSIDPLSIDPLPSTTSSTLPLRATAHDAPLPSILSASLDSWKRHNHLLRILIPTSPITHPVQDPLRDGKTAEPKPEWYQRLTDRGALVEVRITPLPQDQATVGTASAKLASAAGTPGSKRVVFNGEKLVVASQKESKAVLARLEDEEAPSRARKISRVPRKPRTKASTESDPSPLPEELQQPLAVAVRLLAPKPETPTLDDLEFPDPKSPGAVTPADEEGNRSPTMGAKSGGASLIARRDTASSETAPSGPLLGILGGYPLSRLSSSMATALPLGKDPTTLSKRTFSLSFVLIVAIISFLLGSLLRSLLTPADYIIYRPYEAEGQQVERALMQAFDPERRWREARRLLEIRGILPWVSRWDLIVAAVRRD